MFRTLLVVVVALWSVQLQAEDSMSSPQPLEVQGHRGARAVLPENTLAAFAYAISQGVDTIEMDLAVTSDDVVIVTHDLHLNPDICLGPKGQTIETPIPVRSLTLKQLKEYDCGTLRNPRFPLQQSVPEERIPTLDEVFELVAFTPDPGGKTVRFNLEIKGVPGLPQLTPDAQTFVRLVLEVVQKHKALDRVVIQSFDHRVLRCVHAQEQKVITSVLVGETLPDFLAVAQSAHASIVSPHRHWITADDVQALHQAGLRVIPWTANTADDWDALLKLGVDGIITDDPAGLIHHLKMKGAR